MTRKPLACAVAISMLLSMAGAAAQNASQDAQEEAMKLRVDFVLLDAQVFSNKTGTAIRGLKASDLALYEDGVRQHIEYLTQEKLPLSIVILIDLSSSIAPVYGSLQQAARHSVQRLGSDDEIAIMAFGGTAKVVLPLTANRDLAAASIKQINTEGLDPGTNINEGVYRAALYLKENARFPRRRVILAITDDVPSNAGPTPSESLVFRTLHENEITVCGLIFGSPVERAIVRDKSGSVRSYSPDTGGNVLSGGTKKIEANLSDLIEYVRTRYSLGYVSTNNRQDGRFRKIKLEILPDAQQRLGEARIVTRKGYYARPKPG